MAVVGDILKVTLSESYLGQLVQNAFFYRLDALPTLPADTTMLQYVAQRFQAVVVAPLVQVQHNSLFAKLIRVDDLTNGIDFFELAINQQGNLGGEGASSFEALNFILRRSTGVTRNGSKRVGGLPEDVTNANSYVGPTAVLSAIQTAFAAPLVDTDTPPNPFATAVIVGRKKYTTSKGRTAYELDLTKINPIIGATFTAVSTQRSRKAGKGV